MPITSRDAIKGRLWQDLATGDAWNDFIDDLAAEADAEIQARLGRWPLETTFTKYYDGNGQTLLPLGEGPLVSVTSVEQVTWTVDGAAPTPSLEDYFHYLPGGLAADGWTREAHLVNLGGVWTAGQQCWKIEFVAGFTTAPKDMVRAATEWGVYLFMSRETIGQQSRVIGDAQQNQLSPKQMDDWLNRILSPYRFSGFA